MQLVEPIIPAPSMHLVSVSLIVGLVVMFVVGIVTVVGALWALSYCIVLFLSYTSSVQLVIMFIIAYEMCRLGQKARRSRL